MYRVVQCSLGEGEETAPRLREGRTVSNFIVGDAMHACSRQSPRRLKDFLRHTHDLGIAPSRQMCGCVALGSSDLDDPRTADRHWPPRTTL